MSKVMGMMSGCYFVGRGELLEWVNDLLKINYSKVEDVSNGAAFCQIIDAIHPGTVNLAKVNYNATEPFEMTQNYRVLQDSFNKNKISQYIDVVTLTKGKYMASLEMFQWIHGYYEQTGPHDAYDAVARRKATKCAEPKQQQNCTKKAFVRQSGFPTSMPNCPIKRGDSSIGKVGNHMVKNRSQKKIESLNRTQSSHQKENDLEKENQILTEKLRKIEAYCRENVENEIIQPIIDMLQLDDKSNI